jgi:adenylate cyclase class IV
MVDDTQVQETEIQEEVVPEAVEEQVQPEVAPEPMRVQAPQESEGERNFRVLRQEKSRVEKERDEMQRKLKELEAKAESEEFTVGDDDIVEGKHLTKTIKEVRKLREEVRTYQAQAAAMSVESRLRNSYNDFDKIVTADNIKKLGEQYPELAVSIDATHDLYDKAASVYTLIKKFGLNESDPYMEEKQRVQANAVKPRPLASVSPQQGAGALDNANMFANGLTPELRARLNKEMDEAIKNR